MNDGMYMINKDTICCPWEAETEANNLLIHHFTKCFLKEMCIDCFDPQTKRRLFTIEQILFAQFYFIFVQWLNKLDLGPSSGVSFGVFHT